MWACIFNSFGLIAKQVSVGSCDKDIYSFLRNYQALVTQLHPTPCNPMTCSLPASSIYGIFQTRILKWVTISFSRGYSQPRSNLGLLHCSQALYHLSSLPTDTKLSLKMAVPFCISTISEWNFLLLHMLASV